MPNPHTFTGDPFIHRNQKYKARQEGYRNVKKGNIYPVSMIYNKKIKDF